MTVAIVLSSYNGEQFIKEQLLSLQKQIRQADKVYIRDDGSTDNTVSIVKQFIDEYHLRNWILEVNDDNKGWKRNFHDLILSVEEDIIFLCDQDDIWYPEKISDMAAIIEKHSEIDLLACGYDAKYEDDTRRITKKITKSMKNTGAVKRVIMNEAFMNVLRPGCAIAVRNTFCKKICSAWNTELPHDAMIWRCSVINGSGYVYDKSLFMWRRYDTSSSNPNRNLSKYDNKYTLLHGFYIGNADNHLLFLSCVMQLIKDNHIQPNATARKIIFRSMEFEKQYKEALVSKKPLKVLEYGLKYRKSFLSMKSIFINAAVTLLAKN